MKQKPKANIEYPFIVTPGYQLKPFIEPALDEIKRFKVNQIIRVGKISGIRSVRSVLQLRRFCGICRRLSEDTPLAENNEWNTTSKVCEQLKWATGHVDYDNAIINPNGQLTVRTKSISFRDLPHLEACFFFERADKQIEKICKKIGIKMQDLERPE